MTQGKTDLIEKAYADGMLAGFRAANADAVEISEAWIVEKSRDYRDSLYIAISDAEKAGHAKALANFDAARKLWNLRGDTEEVLDWIRDYIANRAQDQT
jgi:hypothetical protein